MAKNALCIGINDYPGTQNDLSGCINDAHDWAGALETRGFAVRSLLDAQATQANMVAAMSDLIAHAKSGDSLVISYSGHGTWVPDTSGDEPDSRDEGLCPYDINTKGPLLDDDIHALFADRARGVRIVLISDSCHSGSVTRGEESDLDPGAPRARFMPLEAWMPKGSLPASNARPRQLRSGMARVGGDLLLAGARDDQFSWDTSFNGRPNGAFTFYALKTLASLKPDASYSDWAKAIGSYLPSTKLPQNPQIFGTKRVRAVKVLS